jgi:hypothetical protein
VVVGVFLIWAAGSEYRHSRLDDLYTGTSVRGLLPFMDPTALHPPSQPTAPPASGDPEVGPPPSVAPARLPTLDLDADLHDLVEAFQGSTTRIVLVDQGVAAMEVTEPQVARAVARLRRGHKSVAAADDTARATRPAAR